VGYRAFSCCLSAAGWLAISVTRSRESDVRRLCSWFCCCGVVGCTGCFGEQLVRGGHSVCCSEARAQLGSDGSLQTQPAAEGPGLAHGKLSL